MKMLQSAGSMNRPLVVHWNDFDEVVGVMVDTDSEARGFFPGSETEGIPVGQFSVLGIRISQSG
jgi:hypothetical protein